MAQNLSHAALLFTQGPSSPSGWKSWIPPGWVLTMFMYTKHLKLVYFQDFCQGVGGGGVGGGQKQ